MEITRANETTGSSGDGPRDRPDGKPPDPLFGDAVERSLLEVRAVIETIAERHRDQASQDQLITTVGGGPQGIVDTARELIVQGTRSLDVVLAADPGPGAEVNHSLRGLLALAPRTVDVRLLCTPAGIDAGFIRAQRSSERPVDVRLARVPPLQALIVDGRIGLAAAEASVGHRASLIHIPDVILMLRTLYAGLWHSAVPADERIAFGGRARTELSRRILDALREGLADDAAARELGVSVRTYRRHVAEIMLLLGANSRFQAGARAARLGLLDASPPPPEGTEPPYRSG